MVAGRRFGPLMVLVVGCLATLLARAFQVQVIEHELWAREAANLGRSWTIEPYERGTILDLRGRPIVRDEESYELDLVWRDFRRGHPLGQVSEARSLLCSRPVPLSETLDELAEWAGELARLSPRAIDDFGRGAAIAEGSLAVPATDDPAGEQRWVRRSHLHFYVRALLGVDRAVSRALREAQETPRWTSSYLELVARARGRTLAQAERELVSHVEGSVADLERLASHFAGEAGEADEDAPAAVLTLAALVERLERARREVDDAAADDLFQSAAGFEPWRLDEANLAAIDLDWLRQSLFWDRARLAEWVHQRGSEFQALVEQHLAGLILSRSKIGAAPPETRLLDAFAWLFRSDGSARGVLASAPTGWREIEQLAVLDEFPDLFDDVDLPLASFHLPVLPFQEERLRTSDRSGVALVDLLLEGCEDARAFDLFAIDERRNVSRAAILLHDAASKVHVPTWTAEEARAAAAVLRAWNARLQATIAAVLEDARTQLRARGAQGDPELSLRSGRKRIALEERDYVVRDRGARPQRLARDPRYDLVRLVTRFPDRYAGFEARTVSRRVPLVFDEPLPAAGGEPRPFAAELVGKVHAPFLVDVIAQQSRQVELFDLSTRLERSAEEDRILQELAGESLREGELCGGTGIEGYFDAVLAGRNGYRETQGLEERSRSGREAFYRPPVDGLDLVLTLDLDLQRLAQHVIEHPDPAPADEDRPDDEWTSHPVGAIVLATPSGDVLAAASAPTRPGESGAYQDGQRGLAIERTLRQPLVHPPGSVIKTLVAVWAMQFRGVTPDRGLVQCIPEPGELPHWGHVHCHSQYGHSLLFVPIDLRTALRRSCNVYFSFLGDKYFDGDELRRMLTAFGLGQPTGVRSLPAGSEGFGLVENHAFVDRILAPGAIMQEVHRERVANGLTHVSVTPMQIARAYAALATGVLPEMRLVQGMEHLQRPRTSTPLPIDRRVLDFLRDTLIEVVEASDGSAHDKGLDRATLGFQVALKTGSADYRKGMVPHYPLASRRAIEWESGMRKHTWVAGWLPAHDPKIVFVVYVHDTATTSSHGAVHVASQLLRAPEIRAYLAEQGVTVGHAENGR